MFRALTHTRSLDNGNGKSGKTAEIGRNRVNRPSAENGRGNVASIAPLASQRPFWPRNATIGRNANRAIPRPSKSQSARSTRSRA
ncbi:MAG: hypothetical protein WBL72_18305, partial [Thermoguttaceae bacterium]